MAIRRVKLTFRGFTLPPELQKCWFPVPDEASLVAEICQSIAKSFHLGNVALLLRCGGFALLPWLPASVVRDGDDIDVHVAVDAPEATTPDAQAVVAPEGRELARSAPTRAHTAQEWVYFPSAPRSMTPGAVPWPGFANTLGPGTAATPLPAFTATGAAIAPAGPAQTPNRTTGPAKSDSSDPSSSTSRKGDPTSSDSSSSTSSSSSDDSSPTSATSSPTTSAAETSSLKSSDSSALRSKSGSGASSSSTSASSEATSDRSGRVQGSSSSDTSGMTPMRPPGDVPGARKKSSRSARRKAAKRRLKRLGVVPPKTKRANPRHTAPPQARQVAPAPPPTQNEATAPNQMGAAELARQEPAQGAVDVPDHSGRGSEPLWGSRRREDPGALVQPPRRKRMRAEAAVRTTIDAGGGPVAPAPDSVRAIVPENTAPPSLEALLRAGRPASGLPSVGDALAYRVLEIGNDLTPVLSDHRVGVVTTVDEASGRVVLAPQPSGIGAPPLLEEGDEEEAEETGGAEEGEEEEEWEVRPRMEAASIYDEDGTLDIAFGDLSEVLVLPGDALGGTGGDALPVREEGGEEEEGIPGGRSAAVRVSVGVGATACRHTAEGGEEGLVGEVVGVGGGAEGGLEGDVTARARRLSGIKALMRSRVDAMVATHASGHDMAPNGAGNGRQGGHDREAQRRGPALMPGEQARGAVDDAAPMTSHDAGMIRDPGEAPGARKDAPPAADAVATGGRLPRDGAGRMGDVTGVGGVEGTRGEAGEAVALKRAAGGDGKAEAAASGRQGGGGGVPSNGVPEVEVSEITLATMTPEVGGGGRGRGRGRGRGGKDANRIKPRPGARRAALGPMLKAMRTSGHI